MAGTGESPFVFLRNRSGWGFIACKVCEGKMANARCECDEIYMFGHKPNCTAKFAQDERKHDGHAKKSIVEIDEYYADEVVDDTGKKDYVVKCKICLQKMVPTHCEECNVRFINGHASDCKCNSSEVAMKHCNHKSHEV